MNYLSNSIYALGVILSIFFYEITGISPGGIIVPAYFMMYLDRYEIIVATILVSVITLCMVKFISNYTILFGKRKFSLMVMVSVIIGYVFTYLPVQYMGQYIPIIGYIIPGILAYELDKQGSLRTLSSLLIVTLALKFIVIIIESV